MILFILIPIFLVVYTCLCIGISAEYLKGKYEGVDRATDEECLYTLFNVMFWPITLPCLIIRCLRKLTIYLIKNGKRLSHDFLSSMSLISWDILKYSWTYIKNTINWTFRT